MAAGYCTRELEQVANRLLPPEIIAEIGIADTTKSAAACRSQAVIEGLASHLASILGLAGVRTQHRPRPANATPDEQHSSSSRVLTTNGGTILAHNVATGPAKNDDDINIIVLRPGTVKMLATPSMSIAPPPAGASLLSAEGRQNNGSGTGVFLPAMHHQNGSGTGVFMPLAGAYRTRPFKSRGTKGLKPPRLMRKEALLRQCQWQ